MRRYLAQAAGRLLHDEGGHAGPGLGDIVGTVGAIVLTVGAASDEDVVTIIGGIVLAVGIFASGFLRHIQIDYGIFDRLNALEKKD